MNVSLRLFFCVALAVVFFYFSFIPTINARQSRRNQYILIGSECSKALDLRRLGFERLINMARREASHGNPQFDRTVSFDLNGDGAKEYLVPFDCGGTGNCDWAVFAVSPRRFLGVVAGQYLYVERIRGRWPQIKTYTHMGASDGVIATFRFMGRRYQWLRDETPVNIDQANMPRNLVRAKEFCNLKWNPRYLNETPRVSAQPNNSLNRSGISLPFIRQLGCLVRFFPPG